MTQNFYSPSPSGRGQYCFSKYNTALPMCVRNLCSRKEGGTIMHIEFCTYFTGEMKFPYWFCLSSTVHSSNKKNACSPLMQILKQEVTSLHLSSQEMKHCYVKKQTKSVQLYKPSLRPLHDLTGQFFENEWNSHWPTT